MSVLNPVALRPTRVRYLMAALCVAMSVLLYLDRFAISPLTGTLLTELHVNKEQLGRTFFAFFLAYGLMQMPAGWLSDAFGARRMLAVYVAGWSLATVGMGLVNGLAAIFVVRFALGMAQAGAYPAAASMLKRWIPYSARGLANSSVVMGGRAGGLLAFAVTPSLMLLAGRLLGWETGQWRAVFVFYGALGLLWTAAFVLLYRNSPREHPWCNAAEEELIAPASRSIEAPINRFQLPIGAIFKSLNVQLLCLISFCFNVGWVFLVSWMPQYLVETHGAYVTKNFGDVQVVSGLLTAATGFGGMIGSVLGGLATDRLVRSVGPIWGRRLPGICGGFLVTVIYLIAPHLSSIWGFVGGMIAISLLIDFGLGSIWASYQDIGGRHVASVLGCGNMFGNFGAAAFGWLIGSLADHKQWNTVFFISAVAMAVSVVSWLALDPTRPVVPEEATSIDVGAC